MYIYSTNIGTEYIKHGIYSPFFSLQNADCFIILKYLVPVLKLNLKLKLKNNSGAKILRNLDFVYTVDDDITLIQNVIKYSPVYTT